MSILSELAVRLRGRRRRSAATRPWYLNPPRSNTTVVMPAAFARSPTSLPTCFAASTVAVAPPRSSASIVDALATRAAGDVVDRLHVDVLVRTEHREARPLGGAHDLLAHAAVPPLAVLGLGEPHANDPLLLRGLAGLAQHALAGVADALALVRLGLADLADVGRDLADELLVEAAHDDARRLRNLERDAGRAPGRAPGARSRPRARSRSGPAPRRGSRRRRSRAPWRSRRRHRSPCSRSAMRCRPCNERFDRESSTRARRSSVSPSRSIGDVADDLVLELALRALHASPCAPSIVTSTPLGIVIGCLSDARHDALRYQTWHRTSPPTLRSRASRSVSRPWLVDRIAIPMPPSTRRHAVGLRVDAQARARHALQPGDRAAAIARVLHAGSSGDGPGDRAGRRPRSRRCSPRARGCSATASFSFDDGIATSSWNAMFALRMRVSMSAIGSVIVTARPPPSPRALRHAGNLTRVRHLPQAETAQPEVAVHRARATATPAARVAAHLELRLRAAAC